MTLMQLLFLLSWIACGTLSAIIDNSGPGSSEANSDRSLSAYYLLFGPVGLFFSIIFFFVRLGDHDEF